MYKVAYSTSVEEVKKGDTRVTPAVLIGENKGGATLWYKLVMLYVILWLTNLFLFLFIFTLFLLHYYTLQTLEHLLHLQHSGLFD